MQHATGMPAFQPQDANAGINVNAPLAPTMTDGLLGFAVQPENADLAGVFTEFQNDHMGKYSKGDDLMDIFLEGD